MTNLELKKREPSTNKIFRFLLKNTYQSQQLAPPGPLETHKEDITEYEDGLQWTPREEPSYNIFYVGATLEDVGGPNDTTEYMWKNRKYYHKETIAEEAGVAEDTVSRMTNKLNERFEIIDFIQPLNDNTKFMALDKDAYTDLALHIFEQLFFQLTDEEAAHHASFFLRFTPENLYTVEDDEIVAPCSWRKEIADHMRGEYIQWVQEQLDDNFSEIFRSVGKSVQEEYHAEYEIYRQESEIAGMKTELWPPQSRVLQFYRKCIACHELLQLVETRIDNQDKEPSERERPHPPHSPEAVLNPEEYMLRRLGIHPIGVNEFDEKRIERVKNRIKNSFSGSFLPDYPDNPESRFDKIKSVLSNPGVF